MRGRRLGPVVAAGLCVPIIVKCDDDVKLTTYNVLSPKLASQRNFPAVNSQDLEKDVRWPKICDRLQKAADEDRIIALQEVDLEWAGKLHSFFAERGYAVVFAQYGNKISGYMGVTLAWPTKLYEAVDVEISKMTDTAPKDAWPKSQQQSLSNFGYMTYDGLVEVLGCRPPVQGSSDDEWNLAQTRNNEAIFAKLKMRGTSNTFTVGTYHMPCLFGTREKVRALNIHTRLLMTRLGKFAQGTPVVLMGDFNLMPGTSSYQVMENGGSAEGIQREAAKQEVCMLDGRLPPSDLSRLQSAYKVFYGQEPLFTNYTLPAKGQEPFAATLDYIWFSPEKLRVVACEKLPQKEDVKGPFPSPLLCIALSDLLQRLVFISSFFLVLHVEFVVSRVILFLFPEILLK